MKSRIRHKVSCFVWLMAKEAVLTQDNVMKRGVTLYQLTFPKKKRGITLCSSTSNNYGDYFSALKGISWTMPRKVTEALMSWEEEGFFGVISYTQMKLETISIIDVLDSI
ncbi:hypothetical protein H5410_057710 [Solanum commersonii]|uniref:Reverse transcriptase zinc-binding domain-containing protein n=1 Tax=Solanum commersonii TaxID=4109 RepID=A0A9J5WRE1_SOLCO|nr:hypothetical protein H5410_057710 [Solanum commersonii]